jgi:PAS domain S-box-containing protein
MDDQSLIAPHAETAALHARIAELEYALTAAQIQIALQGHQDRILQSIPIPILVLDLTGHIRWWNRGAERLFGYSAAEAIGQTIALLLPPERQHELPLIQAGIARGDDLYQMEAVRVRKDGARRTVALTSAAIRDVTGAIASNVVIFDDITDQQQIQAVLRAQEARYRTLVEQLPVVIFQADLDDVNSISYVSPQIKALLGYTPEEWLADPKLWISRIHPEDLDRVLAVNRGFEVSGQLQSSEHRMIARDGRVVWVRDEMVIVRDDSNRPPYFLGITQDITVRKQAEDSLYLRDRAIAAANTGILITDPHQPDNPIIYANPAFEQITGYRVDEALGRNCRFLQGAETDPEARATIRAALAEERHCHVVLKNYRKDGTFFWNELFIAPVRDTMGCLTHFVGVQTDITERKRLEAQVIQAQKMESVGRVAGGIAHDFNNLLTAIVGYTNLALESLAPSDLVRDDLEEVVKATERARQLTQQLLTFARKQPIALQVLNLNDLIHNMAPLIRRLIGEHIELITRFAPELWTAQVDTGQIEQVLLNLAVNARDAMPGGGVLSIQTANVTLDEWYVLQYADVTPGDHVLITVSDTGEGMSQEVQRQAFEPFFTTKDPGKGTGLGLATCYGIIAQHRGHITLASTMGRGTTVRIYLPRLDVSSDIPADTPTPLAQSSDLPRGTETVLLAEDEAAVRALAARVLRAQGYTVLEASHGIEALRMAHDYAAPIDLLLSDVVMPRLGGFALATQLTAQRPTMKVLLMSGYIDETPSPISGGLDRQLIHKPFTPTGLVQRVREVLDTPQEGNE